MSDDPNAFFLPKTIPDRKAAAGAIAAGAIAGALLMLTTATLCVIRFMRGFGESETTGILLALTLVLLVITVGIWKHILSAAVIGVFLGVAVIVWAFMHNQYAAALILAVPIVGGFFTAARGILMLKHRT